MELLRISKSMSLALILLFYKMSDEVWKYFPHVPAKKPLVLKRKSEVTDK